AGGDLAVGGGGAGRREGAAVVGLLLLRAGERRLPEALRLQARRRRLQGALEEVHLDVAVEGDDVEQVNGPAVEGRPGGGGAVGDALHLLEVFRVEAAQEQ